MIRLLSTKEKCVLTWTFFNHEKLYQPVAHPPAERILPQRFWSSDKLTGSQTYVLSIVFRNGFGVVTN